MAIDSRSEREGRTVRSGAGIAEWISALDRLMLRCAAIITLRVRTSACATKQGTLPHLLHLWTEM